ncbi:MAG: hypothetical protein WAW20_21415, partial [Anaerolineae bacterium]
MLFPEGDWRHLSRLKASALQRLCRVILDEAQGLIAAAEDGGCHSAYLALYRHIQERDQLVADSVNRWSRSHALSHLVLWRQHNLITDEEFAAFSPETRAAVDAWF